MPEQNRERADDLRPIPLLRPTCGAGTRSEPVLLSQITESVLQDWSGQQPFEQPCWKPRRRGHVFHVRSGHLPAAFQSGRHLLYGLMRTAQRPAPLGLDAKMTLGAAAALCRRLARVRAHEPFGLQPFERAVDRADREISTGA